MILRHRLNTPETRGFQGRTVRECPGSVGAYAGMIRAMSYGWRRQHTPLASIAFDVST